ncbi:MAG: DUF4214 domain-containing protein [Bdellovibrionaceae bacterium]|nr:DUF4214 domain-containing protein [Pseudobdellovibrionaceae bacterium]
MSFLKSFSQVMLASGIVFGALSAEARPGRDDRGQGRGGYDRGEQDRGRDRDGDFGRGGGRPGPGGPIDQGFYDQRVRRNADWIVNQIYRAVLFRDTDAQGAWHSIRIVREQGLAGLVAVARSVGNSPEYYRNIHNSRRAGEIVNNIYWQILGRQPDAEGFRSAISQVRQGRTGDLLAGMVSSPEFLQRLR